MTSQLVCEVNGRTKMFLNIRGWGMGGVQNPGVEIIKQEIHHTTLYIPVHIIYPLKNNDNAQHLTKRCVLISQLAFKCRI